MKIRAFLTVVVLIAVLSIGERTLAVCPTLSLHMESAPRSPIIKVQLTNDSSVPVELYTSFLPWRLNGMLLLACESRPNSAPLTPFIAIDDPDDETISLSSGASLIGDIDLSRRFPSFNNAISTKDVIIFWSYQPHGPGISSRCKQQAGAIVLVQN